MRMVQEAPAGRRSIGCPLPRCGVSEGGAAGSQSQTVAASRYWPRTVLHDWTVIRRITSVIPSPILGIGHRLPWRDYSFSSLARARAEGTGTPARPAKQE